MEKRKKIMMGTSHQMKLKKSIKIIIIIIIRINFQNFQMKMNLNTQIRRDKQLQIQKILILKKRINYGKKYFKSGLISQMREKDKQKKERARIYWTTKAHQQLISQISRV